jgi:hypothetical protein
VNVRTGSVEARPEFGAAARDPEWGAGGQIVYTAPDDDGVAQVFRGSRQLTATRTRKRFPVVSPDTTQIAFSEGNHITVLSADGEREIGRIDGATDPAWSRMPAAGHDERPDAGATFILRPFAYDGTEFREGVKKMPEGDDFPTRLRDRVEVEAVVGLDVPPAETVRVDASVEGSGRSVLTLANGFFSVVQDDATDGPVATFQGGPGLDDCPGYPRARPAGSGKGRGKGKTKGGYASAGTGGTEWELEETCAFTRITVFEGSVKVDAPGDQFDRADLGPADSPYVIPNPG